MADVWADARAARTYAAFQRQWGSRARREEGSDARRSFRFLETRGFRELTVAGAHALQDFYEDVFEELDKFGEVENLNVCDNLADHLVGNVYVKFREEEAAQDAVNGLSGRFYAGAGLPSTRRPSWICFRHCVSLAVFLSTETLLKKGLGGNPKPRRKVFFLF